jgi:uncharacterized protein (TIGR03086 family)
MSLNLRNYVKAVYGFDHVLRLTKPAALKRKSPCEGWTGADVLAHALGGMKAVHSAATVGRMPKTFPKVGDDAVAAFAKLRDQTIEALDQPDVLARVADTFFGPMPVDTFIGFMGADLIVHAWDLARTAKIDERLDPALCKATLATWKSLPEAMLRSPNVFGPALKAPAGADAQVKLLAFLGRSV